MFDIQSVQAFSLNVVRSALFHEAVYNEQSKYYVHIVVNLKTHHKKV